MTEVKVGFVRDHTLTSTMIRLFGILQTGDARFSHCFFIINDDYTVEALFQGLRSQDFKKAYKDREILVYKLPCLSPDQHKILAKSLITQLGQFKSLYGYIYLPFMAGDALASFIRKRPTFWFTKAIKLDWFPFCSFLIGREIHKLRNDLLAGWRSYSPDYLDDIMRTSSQFTLDHNITTYKG